MEHLMYTDMPHAWKIKNTALTVGYVCGALCNECGCDFSFSASTHKSLLTHTALFTVGRQISMPGYIFRNEMSHPCGTHYL